MNSFFLIISFLGTCILSPCLAEYAPAKKLGSHTSSLTEFSYSYQGAERKVALKLYLPEQKMAPTIFLSHGLGGSREVGAYLATHWAERGFVVIAMQHEGSDSEVWKNAPRGERFKHLKAAASLESFLGRKHDVKATIDQVEKWNRSSRHLLYGRVNTEQLAIGGHSFGAVSSQATTGQIFPLVGAKYTDSRLKAALLLSPSQSKGIPNSKAFGQVSVPWMCMTGTKDSSMITPNVTPESRKEVFAHLPASGSNYQLVLKDARHAAFSDRTMIGTKHKNANHHRLIIALSTAFFEAHLKENKRALVWLQSEKPKAMLEAGDTWERK